MYAADSYNRGGGTFRRLGDAGTWEAYADIEELLIHPDALDVSKQRFGEFYWALPDGYTDADGKSGMTGLRWQFQVTEVSPVAYNTTTVSQETLDSIQSYRDLLRPEIVERTVMDNFFIASLHRSQGCGCGGSWAPSSWKNCSRPTRRRGTSCRRVTAGWSTEWLKANGTCRSHPQEAWMT